MNNVPSASEQKERVYKHLDKETDSFCYIISKKWWDTWLHYINKREDEEEKERVEQIDNSELM